MPFSHYHQLDSMDCGPTCLRMVAKYHGRSLSAQKLREAAEIGKDGVNLLGIILNMILIKGMSPIQCM